MSTGWDNFAAQAAALGAPLLPSQVVQFAAYEALLLEWNERIALTAIREPGPLRVRHFLDALSCAAATGPLAVSYTHLDVYKRQRSFCRRFSRSALSTDSLSSSASMGLMM